MAKRTIRGSRALVTGASSGIGRAVAIELARAGANLVLVARREEPLHELAGEIIRLGGNVEIVPGDVTAPDIRREAVRRAGSVFGGLDILVNNAGVSAHGRFEDENADVLRRVMEVNFFAAVELTREALPLLRNGRDPLVVNVGSILGFRGIPFQSEYCASKFALRGFSQSLRAELAPSGIDVLLVSPGTTDTEFLDHLVEKKMNMPWRSKDGVSPERVARKILRAIAKRKWEIVPTADGKMLLFANRFFPRTIDRLMARFGSKK